MKPNTPLKTYVKNICEAMMEVNFRDQPDFIVVNNSGILVNVKYPGAYGFPEAGLYLVPWGKATLAGFLLYLNTVPSPTLEMQKSFVIDYLEPYLKNLFWVKLLNNNNVTDQYEKIINKS